MLQEKLTRVTCPLLLSSAGGRVGVRNYLKTGGKYKIFRPGPSLASYAAADIILSRENKIPKIAGEGSRLDEKRLGKNNKKSNCA